MRSKQWLERQRDPLHDLHHGNREGPTAYTLHLPASAGTRVNPFVRR
jgi:hypothetical protein